MPRIITILAALVFSGAAFAQAWPAKPVRVIVPFAAGGSLDFVTRMLSDRLSQELGQPFIVENRTGANGNIGAEYVAKQPADGYVLLSSADALTSSAHLYKLGYDAIKDLVPIVQYTRQPLVLAVHPSLGVSTVAELIAAAKAKPGIGYATSGAGSGQHIAGEWLAQLAGIKLTHVPYKGGGQAIGDLVGGQVQMASLGSTPVMPHYKAGKVKIIAQSTETRVSSLPEVPTYQESGLRGLVLDQWLGLFAPAGTPPQIVQQLNASVARILAEPSIRQKLAPQGLDAVGGTPEQFASLYRSDYEKYGRLVKELNIKIE
ncbi:MAG: tripartite tricarboxylate transporter substrate binding protein [Betaproteobacteria bacterium]|nr:tripartite tricarboxylate transporter substrate binding protein [Betaproteobacteria bacterium]